MNDTPDNKNLPAGRAKRSSPLLRILPLAVLAAVLVYFAAQIHGYFSDPMTVTVTYESQAEDTVSMEGWLVRTEEPLPAQSGTVSRQVQEGQRVAAGQTVATVYSDDSALQTVSQIDTLELQLQQLQFALTSYLDPDAALKLDTSITGDILALRRTLSGSPKIIIRDGIIDQKVLEELRFSADDLMTALRGSGVFDVTEVQFAIVETTGSVSVYPKHANRPVTNVPEQDTGDPPDVLISDGKLIPHGLAASGLDRAWIQRVLNRRQLKIQDVFLLAARGQQDYCLIEKEGNGCHGSG